MRIKDDGKYEWRKEQYAQAAEQPGENTKSKGIDAATGFAIEMLSNLERAMEHMTEELAEILSTDQVNRSTTSTVDRSYIQNETINRHLSRTSR